MESLSTLPLDLLQWAAPLGGVGLLVSVFWYRAHTMHSIMERLWRVVAGDTPVSDPRLAEFMDETRELERFRFIYGVSIDSRAQLHRFLAWREQQRLPMLHIQWMREWFDTQAEHFVRQPHRLTLAWKAAVCLFWLAAMLLALSICVAPPAVMKMKASGVWVTTDGSVVKPAFGLARITLADCGEPAAAQLRSIGFTDNEETLFCAAARDGSLRDVVEKNAKDIAMLAFVAELVFIVLLVRAAQTLTGCIMAFRLPRRLRKIPAKAENPALTVG